jgi:hypothetical protein
MNGPTTPSRRFAAYSLLAAGIGGVTVLGTACQDKKPPEVPADSTSTDSASATFPNTSVFSTPDSSTESEPENGSGGSGGEEASIEIDGDDESLLAEVGKAVNWKFTVTGDGSDDYHIHKITFDPPPAGVEVANNESEKVQVKGSPQSQDPPSGTVEVIACRGSDSSCEGEISETFDWTFEGLQNGTVGTSGTGDLKQKIGVSVLKTAVGFFGCIISPICASGADGRGGTAGVLATGLTDFFASASGVPSGGYPGNVGGVFGATNQFGFGMPGYGMPGVGMPGYGGYGTPGFGTPGFGYGGTYSSIYSSIYSSTYSDTYSYGYGSTYSSYYSSTYSSTYSSSYGYGSTYSSYYSSTYGYSDTYTSTYRY